MTSWTQTDVHPHMDVYTNQGASLGKVAAVYEDSFQLHKGPLHSSRYIPYSAIERIEQQHLTLKMSEDEVDQEKWKIRPDYENHLGDPTQLFYDRDHGVHDPFDQSQD